MSTTFLQLTLLIFVTALAGHASAQQAPVVERPSSNVQMQCKTDTPSTSFAADTQDGVVAVHLINHNGAKFLPVHSGLVTTEDLPKIAARSKLMQRLGQHVFFSWPIAKCKHVDHKRFHCFGGTETKTIDGMQVQGFAIDTGYSKHENVGGVYERMTVTMSFIIDREMYSVMMEYDPKECRLAL